MSERIRSPRRLTPREIECIEAYREQGTEADAAVALGTTLSTMKNHLSSARSKRGVRKTWMLFDHLWSSR